MAFLESTNYLAVVMGTSMRILVCIMCAAAIHNLHILHVNLHKKHSMVKQKDSSYVLLTGEPIYSCFRNLKFRVRSKKFYRFF